MSETSPQLTASPPEKLRLNLSCRGMNLAAMLSPDRADKIIAAALEAVESQHQENALKPAEDQP